MAIYYFKNNSTGSMFGRMSICDASNNVIAKVKHHLIGGKHIVTNADGQFLFRIDENALYHIFSISFDQGGNDVVFEFGRKGSLKAGFGMGHFVMLPLATLPFGSYYGVSRRGDIYVKRNGKFRDVYIDDVRIAQIRLKRGYVASLLSSKSTVEMFTTDDELTKYVFAMIISMDANIV